MLNFEFPETDSRGAQDAIVWIMKWEETGKGGKRTTCLFCSNLSRRFEAWREEQSEREIRGRNWEL